VQLGCHPVAVVILHVHKYKKKVTKKFKSGGLHERHVVACGNKMPTRSNRGFYCRSYCLLNMFRAPLCPSSGAQEQWRTQEFFSEGVQQIQLRTEDRGDGDLGAVAP